MKLKMKRLLKGASVIFAILVAAAVVVPRIQLILDEKLAIRLVDHIKSKKLNRERTIEYLRSELPSNIVLQPSSDLATLHVELQGRTVFSVFAVGTSWWYIDIEFDQQGQYKKSYKALAAVYL